MVTQRFLWPCNIPFPVSVSEVIGINNQGQSHTYLSSEVQKSDSGICTVSRDSLEASVISDPVLRTSWVPLHDSAWSQTKERHILRLLFPHRIKIFLPLFLFPEKQINKKQIVKD